MAPRAAGEARYGLLLRNPSFARVFAAGLASVAGSAISSVCLVWIVFTETGSALDVGLLGTSFLLAAIVFSLIGGALVDRYDRRRLMIVADFSRALAMGLVAVDLAVRGFDLVGILAAFAVVGAFTTVFNPAEQAILPSLVDGTRIADANGLVRSSRSALQFVGASIAGAAIVTLGANAGVAANAATYVLSGVLLLGMRVPSPPHPGGSRPSAPVSGYFREIREGLRWLRDSRGFLQLTVSATFFNFCSSLVGTFLVIFATVVLHGSALVYALLLAANVAGTGIGSLLAGRTHGERWAGRAWVVPYGVLGGLTAVLLAEIPIPWAAFATLLAMGLVSGYAGTAWLTAAQLLVPTEMQGRYFGIDGLGSIAILPIAQIGGAFLIDAVGIQRTYLAVGLIWLVVGLLFLLPKALRDLGYRPNAPALSSRTGADGAGRPGSPAETRAG